MTPGLPSSLKSSKPLILGFILLYRLFFFSSSYKNGNHQNKTSSKTSCLLSKGNF